jgi:hypothetical protein
MILSVIIMIKKMMATWRSINYDDSYMQMI